MHTTHRRSASPAELALVLVDPGTDDHRPSLTAMVTCIGEFDPQNAPVLHEVLARAEHLQPDRLVVDLREVTFMDASTIGEFVRTRTTLREQRATLVLRGVSPTWQGLLALLRLDDLIEPHTDDSPSYPSPRAGAMFNFHLT